MYKNRLNATFLGVSIILLFSAFSLHADGSCIGVTTTNPENGVREEGPLRFVNCSCTCDQYRWLANSRCPTCLHKHSGKQTVGPLIEFKEWLPGLTAWIEQKKLIEHVANIQETIHPT